MAEPHYEQWRYTMSLTRVARRLSFYRQQPMLAAETHAPAPGSEFTPEGARYKYDLETYFEGDPANSDGMVVNLAELDQRLRPWLEPVGEETPAGFLHRLAEKIIKTRPFPSARLVKLRLYLGDDHWLDVWP